MFSQIPMPASGQVHAALLDTLNDEQRAAVTLPPEHALILAGAGSGKTRVLTTRMAWLLQTGQVSPGGLLAVTFTNKAAKEMVARLTAMLPLNVRGLWIGTFHGLCNRFLRAHHQLAQLPAAFQILDTQDQLSAIKRLCKQFNVDDERYPPKELQWFIAGCKEEGLRPKDVPVHDAHSRQRVELYQLYEDQCQREGVVDFGELMLRSYELLRDNDPIREHYRRRFRHVLVDEFQDTNRLQYAWLKMIVGLPGEGATGGAIMAVGDDDQSIYAFRGACVGNMADFVREFSVAHQIKLEQNYRSTSAILDSANALISHNRQRLGKNLRSTAGVGEPVRIYEANSDFAEAQWVVDEITQLRSQNHYALQEVALLYRSNAQSRVLETALFNAGLPYRVYGGLRFFERAEIKHALAYLRLLDNPHDDTSFLRVVNFPPRGIGARSIEQLQGAAAQQNSSLHGAVSATTGKAGAALTGFVALLDVMREQVEHKTLSELIDFVIEHSGLVEHYCSEKEGGDRIENLHELVNAAESFVKLEGFGQHVPGQTTEADSTIPASVMSGAQVWAADAGADLEPSVFPEGESTGEVSSPLVAFLSHAALEAGDNQAQAGQDAVQLMTVHASKGLEFDAVFICGLEEGLFPHENAMSDRDGLEEERRLMYVAITRARQRLYLLHAQTRMLHGQTRYHVRSRFLDELPEEALKWISPAPVRSASFSIASGQPWWQRSSSNAGHRREGIWQEEVKPSKQHSSASVTTSSGWELRAGQAVFHNKFGEGQVLAVEGAGADARAHIRFNRHGNKWLALAVAKLTPLDV